MNQKDLMNWIATLQIFSLIIVGIVWVWFPHMSVFCNKVAKTNMILFFSALIFHAWGKD